MNNLHLFLQDLKNKLQNITFVSSQRLQIRSISSNVQQMCSSKSDVRQKRGSLMNTLYKVSASKQKEQLLISSSIVESLVIQFSVAKMRDG